MSKSLVVHLTIHGKPIPQFNLCTWKQNDCIDHWFDKTLESDISHLWFDKEIVLKLYQILKRVNLEPTLHNVLLPGNNFDFTENTMNISSIGKFFKKIDVYYTKIKINFSYV